MIRVKICGITNLEDARVAVAYGADALGFVFYEKSPRYVQPQEVRKIINSLPPFVVTVGVFVNEKEKVIRSIRNECSLDIIQLHGEEQPGFVSVLGGRIIKAFRVKDSSCLEQMKKYNVSAYLLDAYSPSEYGGTGDTFDWQVAKQAKSLGSIILAGGISPENVQNALSHVAPYAVDVCSGVEAKKGKKDHSRLKNLLKLIKPDYVNGGNR